MTPERLVDDLSSLQTRLASEFENLARVAIAAREKFIVALPGGSVAKTFFPALSKVAADWSRTDFFWIDERAVPPDDLESNYALAFNLWLIVAHVPDSRIHRMRGEEPDLENAARIATNELIAVAGDPPRLDVALVGVGEDGHVASIFPGRETHTGGTGLPPPRKASAFAEAPADRRSLGRGWSADRHRLGQGGQPCHDAQVAAIYDAPKPPPHRLTMTMSVLADAERVIVAALGRSKAAAVRDALEENDCATPLAELLRRSQSTLVLLDRGAADLLSK